MQRALRKEIWQEKQMQTLSLVLKGLVWACGVNPLQQVHFSSLQFHEFGHKQKVGFS